MHWCLLRSSLDMSKPSQTMLHKLLLNWRHSYPLSYIIIPDSVKILKLTFKRQIGQYSCIVLASSDFGINVITPKFILKLGKSPENNSWNIVIKSFFLTYTGVVLHPTV
jgi:hypothetical protein